MHLKRFLRASIVLSLFGFSAYAQDPRPADEWVRVALNRNQDYLAAKEREREAEARIRQAGLKPAPSIEVEVANGALLGSHGESEYSAAYSRTIETAGKRDKRIAIAAKELAIARAEAAEKARQVAYDIRTRFTDFVELQLRLRAMESLKPVMDEDYRLLSGRVGLGDAAPLDQQLLLVEINRAAAQRIAASTAVEAALAQFRIAAGATQEESAGVTPDFGALERTLNLPELQAAAMDQRADLQILRLGEEQMKAEAALIQSEARPDITASARYTRSRSSFDPIGNADNVLTFGVSIPLSQRSQIQPAADAAHSRETQQRLRAGQLARVIPQEVEAAYRRWTGALRTLNALRTGVLALSQQNLTVVREAYRLGQLRLTDVLNEQRRLADLDLSIIEAQAEAARALVELEFSVGGNLP